MTRAARRGLTLIEVVAAIALLSALTVTVLPLLVDATNATAPRAESVDVTDLREFSDGVLADAAMVASIKTGREARISWKGRSDQRDVLVRCVPAADARIPHDWIEFRCGEVRMVRYAGRADADLESKPGGAR